ncbi:hypothetical protein HELRODRAFT_161950 [Helobdella robusta]|uniref:Uncharacterized protein n=1 Tax=Helobdella robusta TaxID=6412 RepID=T1ES27_HELRO|nr:hypothetical protein HELRODRAFT_161950 [Helobdella robusta]ESO02660.1 hypothetical protein HELRODRAFT_161950 [Helobdella robusta]
MYLNNIQTNVHKHFSSYSTKFGCDMRKWRPSLGTEAKLSSFTTVTANANLYVHQSCTKVSRLRIKVKCTCHLFIGNRTDTGFQFTLTIKYPGLRQNNDTQCSRNRTGYKHICRRRATIFDPQKLEHVFCQLNGTYDDISFSYSTSRSLPLESLPLEFEEVRNVSVREIRTCVNNATTFKISASGFPSPKFKDFGCTYVNKSTVIGVRSQKFFTVENDEITFKLPGSYTCSCYVSNKHSALNSSYVNWGDVILVENCGPTNIKVDNADRSANEISVVLPSLTLVAVWIAVISAAVLYARERKKKEKSISELNCQK